MLRGYKADETLGNERDEGAQRRWRLGSIIKMSSSWCPLIKIFKAVSTCLPSKSSGEEGLKKFHKIYIWLHVNVMKGHTSIQIYRHTDIRVYKLISKGTVQRHM